MITLFKIALPSSSTIAIILFYVYSVIASNLALYKIYSFIFFFLSVFSITSWAPWGYGFVCLVKMLHWFKSLLNMSLGCVCVVCVFIFCFTHLFFSPLTNLCSFPSMKTTVLENLEKCQFLQWWQSDTEMKWSLWGVCLRGLSRLCSQVELFNGISTFPIFKQRSFHDKLRNKGVVSVRLWLKIISHI